MNLWNLLPPALVTRAKTVVALIGGGLWIAVNFDPDLTKNHYVAVAISVLTVLGVWTVPNSNAKVRKLKAARLAAKYASMHPSGTATTSSNAATHGFTNVTWTYGEPR